NPQWLQPEKDLRVHEPAWVHKQRFHTPSPRRARAPADCSALSAARVLKTRVRAARTSRVPAMTRFARTASLGPAAAARPSGPGQEAPGQKGERVLVALDGTSLTCAGVADLAAGRATARIAAAGFERARAAAELARELAARQPVYGRTTGVGANRSQAVP